MTARPRVLITEPEGFSPLAVERLRAVADVELSTVDRPGLVAALGAYDVVWLRLGHRLDADTLAHATRCRIIATPVTGLDHLDLEACAARGIRVVSLRGEVAFLRTVRATAEHTLALMLALLRRLPAAHGHVLEGGWDRDLFRGRELGDKVVGLVGVGRLGTLVAGYLRAFGCTVLGYDPRPDYPHDVAERVSSLPELMARVDIVSLHLTYDRSTRHLIDAAQLAYLRPHAVLINTARGGVLDDRALYDALVSHRLAGAALDVIDGEPEVGRDHPLVALARTTDRVLITPHLGGNTFESFEKTELFLAGRVVAALGS